MSSGSSNSSILNMPDYGQGLAEALQAQSDALSGKLTGTPLQEIVERYERPLRMSAAQIDNDVLRQTLLGDRVPITAGQPQPTTPTAPTDPLQPTPQEPAPTTQIDYGGTIEESTGRVSGRRPGQLTPEQMESFRRSGETTTQIDYGGTVDESTGKVIVGQGEIPEPMREFREIFSRYPSGSREQNFALREQLESWVRKNEDFLNNDLGAEKLRESLGNIRHQGPDTAYQPATAFNKFLGQGENASDAWAIDVIMGFNRYGAEFIEKVADQFSTDFGTPEVQYKKNPDGTDFIVPKDADGNFILEANEQSEVPDGGTLPTTPAEPTTPTQPVDAENITGYKRAGTGLIDMLGDRRMALDPTTGLPSNRESGFDDQGNFLGLAALAEDIQRGNLSRQREADIADVERLSGRYQTIMDDYKPATSSGLDDARLLLEQQRENLTGLRKATQADVDAGNASEVGELFQTGSGQGGPISMPNALDPQNYGMSGDAAIGTDTLRSALLADAKSALGDGLSDRETRAIQNSARARSGLMGRTFDQSGAIEESKALIQEDNNRRMQNRAFAQSALGQEATIQQGDVSRAMTTDQFNVGAKMDAERLNESLRQQGLGNYINAVGNLAQIEDKYTLDPFQAILGRAGGGSLQAGQGVFGQAGYGLQSGPQYMNPEAGLGYISNMAANEANMYAAQLSADATRDAGLMSMFGSLGGGFLGNEKLFGK